jgi:hypothetical protein
LAYSSILKMEATCSSETSVATQQTSRRHIPEDDTLHNHRCENLKPYMEGTCSPKRRLASNALHGDLLVSQKIEFICEIHSRWCKTTCRRCFSSLL